MKVTKSYLKQVIKEELRRLTETETFNFSRVEQIKSFIESKPEYEKDIVPFLNSQHEDLEDHIISFLKTNPSATGEDALQMLLNHAKGHSTHMRRMSVAGKITRPR
jgi:hypothetical protein